LGPIPNPQSPKHAKTKSKLNLFKHIKMAKLIL
jgi:hypothetical protein